MNPELDELINKLPKNALRYMANGDTGSALVLSQALESAARAKFWLELASGKLPLPVHLKLEEVD